MLAAWIWLGELSLSCALKKRMLEAFSAPEGILEASEEALSGIPGVKKVQLEKLLQRDLTKSREILEKCREKGLKVIPYSHPAYPALLRQIKDPPMVLYMRGRLPELASHPAVAVVGTRKCSPEGLAAARRISGQIAACGGIVTSGMAFGIDAQAAMGALDAGKPVIGVLGCGADVVYPKQNKELFEKVLETGCVLSEYPPETPAAPWRFPERNRIVSGMTEGTLVVEAPEKSGALITAGLAQKQGRQIFVVPGSVENPACAGSNLLLRQGGKAVLTGWDLVSEYQNRYPVKQEQLADSPVPTTDLPKSPAKKQEKQTKQTKQKKTTLDKEEQSSYIEKNERLPELTEEEKQIVSLLSSGPMLTDAVIEKSGLPAGSVMVALTMLELKELLQQLPGNRVVLRKREK